MEATTAAATRATLHRVAAHVLGRARYRAVGRFGLVASAGGPATPAFGAEATVVRLAGATLVVERAAAVAAVVSLRGATLRRLAAAAGTDVEPGFAVGRDTPPLGDVDEPLDADHDAALALADWYLLGARVLDGVLADLPGASRPQLWPEHFDLGCDVPIGGTVGSVTVGASPGDGFVDEPYLYVTAPAAARAGDPARWNAPFGAALRRSEVPDLATGVAFVRRGLDRLRAEP